MITHIERPILVMELSKIFALNTIDKSEQDVVFSIIQEINQNKNVIDLCHDDKNALIGILDKHMSVANMN